VIRRLVTNPWGRPRFLWVVAIGYVAWTLVPVANAVLFSFNSTRSISTWAGFSLRWWTADPDESLLHDPNLRHAILQSVRLSLGTVLIAVPLGVGFALALDRWRGRGARTANFVMMFSFITPELILAVSLFLLFINTFRAIGLGSVSQLAGLVVLALAYPVVIVRARLLSLGPEYEEAAMDLGASPGQALRRVTVPLLGPTVSMFIYNAARTAPTPASNAVGTLMLLSSTIVIALAYVAYRRAARRPSGGDARVALPV
jgi:spermidine/putrescine transport system permease protein